MEAAALVVSGLGILVAVWIAVRQHSVLKRQDGMHAVQHEMLEGHNKVLRMQSKMLTSLETIARETAETARGLRVDASVRAFAERFFCLEHDQRLSFVFPVTYMDRPLPSIFAGDYYTLSVVQRLIAPERADLLPVTKERTDLVPVTINTNSGAGPGNGNTDPDVAVPNPPTNIVYICGPSANPALALVSSTLELFPEGSHGHSPTFKGVEIPCWIAANQTSAVGPNPQKVLYVKDIDSVIHSEAEYFYAEALLQQATHVARPQQRATVRDCGIIMRLTIDNQVSVVLAGIHQYGTWIVGEFFDQLSRDRLGLAPQHRELFYGTGDFAAIVTGEFDQAQFRVSACGVDPLHTWKRTISGWNRVVVANS